MTALYTASSLTSFAGKLLMASGMGQSRAEVVARILVEGDMMGHTTHGLQLLGPYLKSIEGNGMLLNDEPDVLTARPVAELWDGKNLPGPWLVERAFDTAANMALEYGTGTVVIRRCHHIACLAAYMPPIAERNLVGLLVCSDPANSTVAPQGGTSPVYSPNPVAACFPTDAGPVILDVSMSATTVGRCMRTKKADVQLPYPWVKDAEGRVTKDPSVVFSEPPGSILPLGGLDSGHKGYALGLLVEALTSGLGGWGRADGTTDWGASVFVQVQDPDAFGGADALKRESGWLADACRKSETAPGEMPVRLPGEAGLRRRSKAMEKGVELFPGIMEGLISWAEKYGVARPSPVN